MDGSMQLVAEVERFHGHLCPGVAIGVQAARVAVTEFGRASDANEIVAIVETGMCAVDGIQYITGCTLGRGTLIHLDHGKNCYTFVRTSDQQSLRLAVKDGAWRRGAEHETLLARVSSGNASDVESKRYAELQRIVSIEILSRPQDEIFRITRDPVAFARIPRDMHYVACANCGEMTNVSRVIDTNGKRICGPCADRCG